MIPYGRHNINEQDIQSVVDVLQSSWITQGPLVPLFEKSIANYCGSKHGIAVCNATAALHIACLALGLGEGDVLWTSPNTFVASANCALYCGASVDFVDIDPKTYNMSVSALEEKLHEAEKKGTLPKIVIPVHYAGQSCDMREIKSLADHYGFRLIEDASHALGGKYLGNPVGSGKYSDITIFSFHPVKLITTGEGGMALTNDDSLMEKMRLLRCHCITRNPENITSENDNEGAWHYQQVGLGYNYRLTDIAAALGVSQMTRLDEFIARRHLIAERYDKAFSELPVVVPYQNHSTYSAYHLYPIVFDQAKGAPDRKAVFNTLRKNDINVNVHYIPVHTQPYFIGLGFKRGDFPQAERYYSNAISIPIYAALSQDEQDTVISLLKNLLS